MVRGSGVALARRAWVVANPDTPRWRHFRAVADEIGWSVELVEWAEVLRVKGDVASLLPADAEGWLRLDSFGKLLSISHALAALGGADATAPHDHGQIVPISQLQRGWEQILWCMGASLGQRERVRCWNPLPAVAAMFDKCVTRSHLAAAQIRHPLGLPDDEADLQTRLRCVRDRGWPAVYVKARFGWSGCGLVRLSTDRGLTTMLQRDGRFFNTRRLRVQPLEELMPALRYLQAHGASWECAVPLARHQGQPFDVRMVVVGQRVVATVGRCAPVPITNLHLGGRRLTEGEVRRHLPDRSWHDARAMAVAAARALGARTAGVDVAFDRFSARPFVLEVNAFGDFFPGWKDASGVSVHHHVLRAMGDRLLNTAADTLGAIV